MAIDTSKSIAEVRYNGTVIPLSNPRITTGTIQIGNTQYDLTIPFDNADSKIHGVKIYANGFDPREDISEAPYGVYLRFYYEIDRDYGVTKQCMLSFNGTTLTGDVSPLNTSNSSAVNYIVFTRTGISISSIRLGGGRREWLQTGSDYTWEAW